MTEDTSGRLYVHVVNWKKYQPRSDRPGLPWSRLYSDLWHNDDWSDLSTANRCLLIGLWMDTQRLGVGKVSANITALRSRHSCRRASLEPLIQAGFITLSTTKGEPEDHQSGTLEEKRIEKEVEERSANGAKAPADFLEDLRNGKLEITDLTDKQQRHLRKIAAARARGDEGELRRLGADQ